MRITCWSALMVLALAASGCGRDNMLSPRAVAPAGAGTSLAGAPGAARPAAPAGEAQHVEGEAGPGARYSLDRPAEWNGDLVVYVHGYTNPAAPVALPNVAPLRDGLLAQGYAVAYSSFSENGYAVPEAVRQTHQLRGLFASRFGQPVRTFIVGSSLGGIIGLQLAEKYPQQYSGALLVCGVVGGSAAEVRYIGDTRVLFDYFFPGRLAGGVTTPPPGVPFNPGPIVAAVTASPNQLGALLCASRLPYASGTEAVTSLLNALGFQWQGGADLMDRTHGHQLYDNTGVQFGCPALPAALNADLDARVARYTATPDAGNFLAHYYEPDGRLAIPVLTLHTSRDPVVPAFHEDLYRDKVAAAGKLDLLLQRRVQRYGHVNFATSEILAAFDDLARWSATGVKPAQ
jgi:pimeloyl-ACP methyl ester carboxylesterase